MSGSKSSARAAARAEALGMTVHALPVPELPADGRRTRSGRLKMLVVLAVCAAPVIASYLSYFVLRPQARTNYSALIQPTRTMPALPLRTLDGRAVDAASLRGQWLLLALGPGACDAACEKRLYLQRQLREMLGRERDRVDKVWLVTDDGPLAPALQQALSAGVPVQVLRVSHAEVQAWLKPARGHALDEHLYVVDPMGEWMMRVPVAPDPAKVKRDLDRLLRASASWDTPGR
jgi:hypothetical protein